MTHTISMRRHDLELPIGEAILLADDDGLRALLFPRGPTIGLAAEVPRASGGFEQVTEQLYEYFDGGRREFDIPLAPRGTAFQLRAWQALQQIPYGHTRSYGEQAAMLKDPHLTRAVGLANNRNPISIIIPCHRVIGADDSLVGYGGGLEAKRFLLDLESAAPPLF